MTVIVPAEWAPHRAMWLGFPSHEDLWAADLPLAQAQVAALARALAGPGRERVRLMTGSPEGEAAARALLSDTAGIEIVPGTFGDIWLRDTGPIFTKGPAGHQARGFGFNGWGGKYEMDGDETVAFREIERIEIEHLSECASREAMREWSRRARDSSRPRFRQRPWRARTNR